jgi:hypothetical protein
VQYKLASASTYTTFSTLTGTATTETVTGLSNNVIYDFKITTGCNGGTSTSSPVVQKINIICKLEVSFVLPSLVAPLSWQVDGIVGQTNILSDPPFHVDHGDAIY